MTGAFEWKERFADRIRSIEDAMRLIKPGDRIVLGSCAGVPLTLVEQLGRARALSDNEIVHFLTLGAAPKVDDGYWKKFRHNAFYIGSHVREAVAQGRADYTPVSLSDIPDLFRSGSIRIDVALVSVSPPDKHGYCSFGVSNGIEKSVTDSARLIVAEVNEQMPRVLGACAIHATEIDVLVPTDRPLPEEPPKTPDDVARRIARKVATLVENGSTLQIGTGTIPNAVLQYLDHHKNLGIHTCVLSDGVVPLIEAGVITNDQKTRQRGKVVACLMIGSRDLYEFVDDNPIIESQPSEYVNDPFVIAQQHKMCSINSAFEVDLTGQVCADSLGLAFYSGVGSHADFAAGAARSGGGKPIVALRSTAEGGTISRIVPVLKQGAGVITCRSEVRYVVTEYGVAYLHGKTVRERTLALIQVAHPKFRPWLLSEAKARHLVYSDQIELPIKAPVYPEDVEEWITLKDGARAFMRPLKLTDEPLLREVFYQLSPESIHSRFFRIMAAMPHEKLQEFLRVDYESDMAIVVLTDTSENAPVVAVAHYRLDPRTNYADAAFLVRDDWQRKGVGTQLMKRLADVARRNGILGFTADVLHGNHGMLQVFHRCGYPVESELADGVYSLRIPFADKVDERTTRDADVGTAGAAQAMRGATARSNA
jgi:acyl-CoA hydrolase